MWTLSQVSQAVKDLNWTGIPPSVVEYLIVAGGGSGGGDRGGGGGAGGLLAGYAGITAGSSYTVTVGAGGVYAGGYVQGTNGANSVFGSVTAIQIARAIREQKGYEIDRRRITIVDDVKEAGTHKASIDFGKENIVEIEFEVVSE
jgi:hypothetical protein